MLKEISTLGTVLNKSEQKTIIGGKKSCFQAHGDCVDNANDALMGDLNDCVLGSGSCIASAANTFGNSMSTCQMNYDRCETITPTIV